MHIPYFLFAASLNASARRGSHDRKNQPHTTHPQVTAELVTIIRKGHPFNGQTLKVLGSSNRKGQLTLLLLLPDGSSSLLPARWTNWPQESELTTPSLSAIKPPQPFTINGLLKAYKIVEALLHRLENHQEEHDATGALSKRKQKPVKKNAEPASSTRPNRSQY